jgi:hypothetical protein
MYQRRTNRSETPPSVGSSTPGRFRNHKKLTAIGVVAVLAVAGGAYAFWTSTGGGSGTAVVGDQGTITVAATVTAGIAPGTTEPISFTAANTGSSAITIGTVHLVSVAADASHASCAVGDFTMLDVNEKTGTPAVGQSIPAGATATPLLTGGTLSYVNTAVSQDGCKNALLTLTLATS